MLGLLNLPLDLTMHQRKLSLTRWLKRATGWVWLGVLVNRTEFEHMKADLRTQPPRLRSRLHIRLSRRWILFLARPAPCPLIFLMGAHRGLITPGTPAGAH